MRLPDVILRLLGRHVAKSKDLEHADLVLDSIAEIHVTVVPKRNADMRAGFARSGERLRR